MVIHKTSNQQQLPVPYHAKKGVSWKMAGNVIGRVLLALLLILLLLAVFSTAAHAAGLVMIRWTLPTNTANIRWTTTSLIFMWTADGTGSRGTGWTVSENR